MKKSKIITALIIVVVILVAVVFFVLGNKKSVLAPIINDVSNAKEYKNDELGIYFDYPSSWEEFSTKINGQDDNFGYSIGTIHGLNIIGKSLNYSEEGGREFSDIDLTKESIKANCNPENNKDIKSINGINGIFVYGAVVGLGECSDYEKAFYAVFDGGTKVQNIVFRADPKLITKEEFLKIINSLVIN